MATTKVSELTELTSAADDDLLLVADTSVNQSKKIQKSNITEQNFTTTLKNKLDAIEASADVTDTTNVVAALTAGTNITIAADGTISATDTDTGILNVVEDTTPQLGGNLDLNSNNITGTGDINVTGNSNITPVIKLSGNNAGQYLDNIVTSTLGKNSLNFINTDTTDSAASGGQLSGAITFETSDADSAGVNAFIASSAEGSAGEGRLVFGTGTGGTVNKRINIASNGDISFYEDTGTTAKLFWDASAERLGIGTTSPAEELDISADAPSIQLSSTNASGRSYGLQSMNTGKLGIYDANAGQNRIVLDSSGNVGIGTSSPSAQLNLSAPNNIGGANGTFSNAALRIGTGSSSMYFDTNEIHSGETLNFFSNGTDNSLSDYIRFSTGGSSGSERMRIDSSGNLLVGTTDYGVGGTTNTGIALNPNGASAISRSSNPAITLNRTTSDGDIALFRRDGTNVGSIGGGSRMYARTADLVDNDGSFDLDQATNFTCTPTGNITLTFTNIPDGQSGTIVLVNTGGHTISAAATTKVMGADMLTTITTAGTYVIGYISDGTNVRVYNSAAQQ